MICLLRLTVFSCPKYTISKYRGQLSATELEWYTSCESQRLFFWLWFHWVCSLLILEMLWFRPMCRQLQGGQLQDQLCGKTAIPVFLRVWECGKKREIFQHTASVRLCRYCCLLLRTLKSGKQFNWSSGEILLAWADFARQDLCLMHASVPVQEKQISKLVDCFVITLFG